MTDNEMVGWHHKLNGHEGRKERRSVVSDSATHGLQHARLPCPSLAASLLKFIPIESVMPSNHLILSCPLLCSVFPSIEVFSNESALKYCSFRFRISPSSEYSGLTSFRIDWFDLLAVQGTLKSLLQQHSSKASALQHSAFFMVQLSHRT